VSTGFLWDNESRVERAFNEWIQTADGRRVEGECVRRSRRLMARGVSHYGIAALFESIRYDWHIGLLGDGEYRLNNNHRSLLARHLMDLYPDLAGFFETRELRGRE
jgi:hypothetical protein